MLALLSTAAFAANNVPAGPGYPAACGPDAVKFNVKAMGRQSSMPEPESGKALIYFVEEYRRPHNELGTPTVRLGENGAWLGANRGTSFFTLTLDPGEHHFCADWQSTPPWFDHKISLTSLNVEAGQIYYLRARVTEHSQAVWTLDLDPVNPDEGAYLVSISSLSAYTPKK